MLRSTVADLMEFNTLIHLLVEALACRAVSWMEGGVVAIGAATSAHLAVTVGAGEAGIEYNFLKAFAVFLLEISYKGIISLVVWKIIIHYIILKECKITTFNE